MTSLLFLVFELLDSVFLFLHLFTVYTLQSRAPKPVLVPCQKEVSVMLEFIMVDIHCFQLSVIIIDFFVFPFSVQVENKPTHYGKE